MRPARLLFFVTVIALTANSARAADVSRYSDGTHGKGELRHVNGLPVLTVAGTPEEMGEQAAALTSEQTRFLLGFPREMVRRQRLDLLWPVLLAAGKSMEPAFPRDHLRELDAAVKRLGAERDLAIFGNTYPDVSKSAGCSSLIVGRARSATGGPLFGRNLDYPTLGLLHEYSLLTVYRPKGKKAFASVGFPGLIGCLSGMNEDGLALAVHEVRRTKDASARLDPAGTPYTLAFRRILEECSTVEEAEKLLRSMKRTTMLNLGVCDRDGGAVLEFTTKSVVARRPSEDICTCTNHFCSEALGVGEQCRRLARLDASRGSSAKLGLAEVSRHLHAANQGAATLQTMVFEPAALKLHLAVGSCPSSALPLRELDLRPLFRPAK